MTTFYYGPPPPRSKPRWGFRCLVYSLACLTPVIPISVAHDYRWIDSSQDNTLMEAAAILAFLGIVPGILAIVGRYHFQGTIACILNLFLAFLLPQFAIAVGYEHVLPPNCVYLFAFPFWFPTTISTALLLYLVWRKIRPKAKGRTLPVELGKPMGE